MSITDRAMQRVAPLLEPGEQLETVIPATSGPAPAGLTTDLTLFHSIGVDSIASDAFARLLFKTRYHVIAVTDRAFAVFSSRLWSPYKPVALQTRFPRNIALPQPGGALELWGAIGLDKPYYVHKTFFKNVEAANAALATNPVAQTQGLIDLATAYQQWQAWQANQPGTRG